MKITIRQPLCFSEVGRKDNQEDSLYPNVGTATTENRVFLLCDGVGGHEHGEVASQTVAEALGGFLDSHCPEEQETLQDLFRRALLYAYEELDKQDSGTGKKMGTTMTCLWLHKQGYLVAHIGDSRIYHIRPANTDIKAHRLGIIYQSSDHSLVNDLLRAGELTAEEAVDFPQKNIITRAMQPNMGTRDKADIYCFNNIQSGDYFFLCCDGVLEQLTNERLCEILASSNWTDSEKMDAIKAECDGRTRDNYTAYLIPIEHVEAEADDSNSSTIDAMQGVEIATEALLSVEDEITEQPQKDEDVPVADTNLFKKFLTWIRKK